MTTRRRLPTRRRLSQMYQRVNRKAVHGAECSEDEHHEAFISWVNETEELQTDADKREALHWLYHVPNGKGRGQRIVTAKASLPPPEAFRLKMMGLRPGIFDLRLDYQVRFAAPDSGKTGSPVYFVTCPGLLIELKCGELTVLGETIRRRGTLSPEQTRYKCYMESQSFVCRVCYTWQAAARSVADYMSLDKIAPVFVKGDDRYVMTVTDPRILQGLEAIKE